MKILKITPWTIGCATDSEDTLDFRESVFSQGNGYMGVRGYAPEGEKKHGFERSTFLSGFFEYIKPGTTDMVNQPDFSVFRIALNGSDVSAYTRTGYEETLNLKDGTFTRRYIAADEQGRRTKVETIRFLSMDNVHTAAVRLRVTPENYDGELMLETGIDGGVVNLPISDDQLTQNVEVAQIWGSIARHSSIKAGGLTAETAYSKRTVSMEYRLDDHGGGYAWLPVLDKAFAGEKAVISVQAGHTYTVDKLVAVYSYRDGTAPSQQAAHTADVCRQRGFDGMLEDTAKAWEILWRAADVEMEAPDDWQGAVRYNIFQLIQTDPRSDPYASIGARGLMHGRYKGCYFWDTEIFMLPMFLHTDPQAAKNLLLYRYHTLKDAVDSAKGFSLPGARYPWMASDTGYEQCGTWDTGCCEIHITADIAYAVGRYLELTGDDEFFRDCAAEMLIQTARYWTERFTYDPVEDRYNLLFVKGPDEYCGVTVNNLYTVWLACENLKAARDAVTRMQKEYPQEWKALAEKLAFRPEEPAAWAERMDKAVRRYDEGRRLWIQDDTFEKLEPLNPADYKEDDIPLYHKISYDRLQRYQVLKQADVLMLMAMCPGDFTMEQKQAAWAYYEPKTLHDSTLSFGIHALMAARVEQREAAERYFEKSLFLDLQDVMKNTAREGIHTAALGATWQALIFGFAGLWIDSDGITCTPCLPKQIRKMRFHFAYLGKRYEVRIDEKGAVVETLEE